MNTDFRVASLPVASIAELDRLGDEIAELSAHLDAATAHLLDLIRDFDARGGWGNGFRSCAAWLTWRIGLDPGAARERVRVARALGTLPRLAQALARGELSYAKVRALSRVATPETEEQLLGVGRAGTAEHVERIVRAWRRVDRNAEAAEAAMLHKSRALHVYQDEDGMVVVRGRLDREAGAVLIQALAAARERLYRQTGNVSGRRVHGASDHGPAAGGRAGPDRRDGASSRDGSRLSGRALPGCGPRRCGRAGGPRRGRPVGARARRARFGGDVPAPGVRREPCGDAPRPGRPGGGGRRTDTDHSGGSAAGAPLSRPRLPLPRVRAAVRTGASHPALGQWRPHHAVEPGPPVSPPPPCGSRGGLSSRATSRRRAAISAPRRQALTRRAVARHGACRSDPRAPDAA